MKKNITLTLNRKGICKTTGKSSNQCKSVGHSKYEYEAKIRVLPKLDKDGFIIDHIEIHEAIENVFKGKMDSCERLGLRITYALEKLCLSKGSKLKYVYVKVRPISEKKNDEIMAFMETEVEYS